MAMESNSSVKPLGLVLEILYEAFEHSVSLLENHQHDARVRSRGLRGNRDAQSGRTWSGRWKMDEPQRAQVTRAEWTMLGQTGADGE